LAANARTPFDPGDRWLLSLSPHHIGGLAIVVRAMVGGGTVRIGRGPGAIVEDLKRDASITHCSLVATQLRRALDDDECIERMTRLKAVLLGGGPAPASWRHEAVQRGIPLSATYGMTECASQVTTGLATEEDDADDAGTPLDGVEVRVAGDGEILVRGPSVFAGYFEGGVLRDARRSDGFFATGDRGRFDERGRLHVLGRKDAMFISGGENIHPEEIENALREVSGVNVVCVVAVDDATFQKRPVAFVAGDFDAGEFERALIARLPRFKWPDRIYAMPEEQAARAKAERGVLATLASSETARVLWEK
jgi:O-succinylbenzoic acid--CoA ligase